MWQVFRHNDVEHLEALLRDSIAGGQPRSHRPWRTHQETNDLSLNTLTEKIEDSDQGRINYTFWELRLWWYLNIWRKCRIPPYWRIVHETSVCFVQKMAF